ncbi:MAG TPA: hypothetical protein VJL80_07540 [Aeromicrobium sp.]|nr:hypothetical protein [Aeromicrobium sp.]
MMKFRLDRAAALATAGVFVVLAAVCAGAAFWLSSVILGAVAAAALGIAGLYALRPPVVLKLDQDGYASRVRFESGRFVGAWRDVEEAGVDGGFLVLTTGSGLRAFPLRLVGGQRVQVLKAVNERLNDANGYRPFPN